MGAGKFNAGGNPVMDYHPIQGGVEILLIAGTFFNERCMYEKGMPFLSKWYRGLRVPPGYIPD